MTFSADKSSNLLVIGRRKTRFPPEGEITVFDKPMPWKRTVKYLDVTIKKMIIFIAHVNEALRKVCALEPS